MSISLICGTWPWHQNEQLEKSCSRGQHRLVWSEVFCASLQAYADYYDVMDMTEELVSGLVKAVMGSYQIQYRAGEMQIQPLKQVMPSCHILCDGLRPQCLLLHRSFLFIGRYFRRVKDTHFHSCLEREREKTRQDIADMWIWM